MRFRWSCRSQRASRHRSRHRQCSSGRRASAASQSMSSSSAILSLPYTIRLQWVRTVKPLLRVVLSVVAACWLTGVASARRVMLGLTALMARCARRPWLRLSASLLDAMAGSGAVEGGVKLMSRSRRLRCCAVVKLQMFSRCRELPPRKDRFACRPITCARLFSRCPDYAEVAYTHYSQQHLSNTSTSLAPRRRPHHRSHHGLHSPPHAPPPGARRPRQARLHLRRPRLQSAAAAIVPEAVMDSPASRFPDLRQQTDPPTAAAGHQGHRQ